MEKMLGLEAPSTTSTSSPSGEGSRPEPPEDGATSAAARALAWRFAETNRG